MNHSEHTMPSAGRTRDRMTVDAGWAGWHYRKSMLHKLWRPLSWRLLWSMFALIGVILAWRI